MALSSSLPVARMGNCLDLRTKSQKLWDEIMVDGSAGGCCCFCKVPKPRLEFVMEMLESGGSADWVGRGGDNMIHRAVRLRHMDLLKMLVGKASNISKVSIPFQSSPLHYAIEQNLEEFYVYLAKMQANVSVIAQGETVLTMCVMEPQYYEALRTVVQIVGRNRDMLRGTNGDGLSVVHVAIRERRFKMLDWLTKGQKVPPDITDTEGRPALFYAVELDCAKSCEILLRNGANLAARGPRRMSSLIQGAILRHTNPVKALLWDIKKSRSLARLNDYDKDGNTAVHYAATSSRGGVLKILLDAGCNPNIPNRKGLFPVHIVATQGDQNLMRILISTQKIKCQLDVKDSLGNTPLHRALQHGHERMSLQLLEGGADPVGQENRDGWSALMAAKREFWNGKIDDVTIRRMHQFETVRDLNVKIDRAVKKLEDKKQHRSLRID